MPLGRFIRLPAILDTTLREGELYRRLKPDVRVRVAEALAEVGVDRIELTVDYPPRTERRDVEAVVNALKSYDVMVVIHGRAYPRDVEAAAGYEVDGVSVYLAPTRLHRELKLGGIGFEEALERLREAVELSKSLGFKYRRATVEDASRYFLGEDGGVEELSKIVDELGEAGATIVSVPDTSGSLTPPQAREFFEKLKRLCKTPLSAHFHNDYGHASANTVEAALAGADELQVSILGIGDRNGIADLYEVVAPLIDLHGFRLKIKRGLLRRLYREFSRLSGLRIPFRHPLSLEAETIRAGVHQSMAIKAPEGYIPAGKLEHDFERVRFEATSYLSKKLIKRILSEDIEEEVLEEVSARLAREAELRGRSLSMRELSESLKSMGFKVDEKALSSLLKPERAYILLNLDPNYPVDEMISEILEWDEVEQVDEVYGDVDLVVMARIEPVEPNIVERIRKSFAQAIERMRVLITD